MTHLTELHGTLNRSDFTHLRLQLSLPMTPNDSIQDFIRTHQELHEQFAAAHQPLSELDKCHLFREAVQKQPHIQHAIDSYLVAHPLIGEQAFLALTNHVAEQAPNFAPTVASMGYAANSTPTDQSTSNPSLTLLSSPVFTALLTAAVKAAHPPLAKIQNAPLSALPQQDHIASITAMMGMRVQIAGTCLPTTPQLINVQRLHMQHWLARPLLDFHK